MIVAIGIDVIEIARVEEVMSRRGARFRDRVFTEKEIGYCESLGAPYPSYAARFAAKEAVMKALGTGWTGGIGFQQIEVLRDEAGAPSIQLTGPALDRFQALGATRIHLSLSHSRELAMAQIVLEN